MVVDVNTEKIYKLNISADVYILLYLIYKKNFITAKRYLTKNNVLTETVLQDLVDKRLIHNLNKNNELDLTKIQVRENFVENAIKNPSFFEEFLEHFPIKTVRTDGQTDYLRTDLKRCKVLYNRLTKGDRNFHNDIIKYLDEEVKYRENNNQMHFMKRLPKWLASEEWEIWKFKLKDTNSTINDSLGYGQYLE